MKIDLHVNSSEYPNLHIWSVNMSDDHKEMFSFIIETMIQIGMINQDKLWSAYRGSDNDVAVSEVKK